MTRQAMILKWLIYTLALFPVWFLETAVLRRLPVFGVFPMLLPLAAVAVAVLEGAVAGAGFGLVTGLLCHTVYYGTGGSMILGVALLGACAGMVSQYGLLQNFWGYLLCCTGAVSALDLLRVIWRLLAGVAPLNVLLRVAVPEALWSLVFTPFVYLLFRAVYRRVGGTALM